MVSKVKNEYPSLSFFFLKVIHILMVSKKDYTTLSLTQSNLASSYIALKEASTVHL